MIGLDKVSYSEKCGVLLVLLFKYFIFAHVMQGMQL